MWDILFWLLVLALLAAALPLGLAALNSSLSSGAPGTVLFRPRPEKRLEVVEQTSIDGRRKLVLIRRDHVEHLVMTGGPADVVIETGIDRRRERIENGETQSGIPVSRPQRPGPVAAKS